MDWLVHGGRRIAGLPLVLSSRRSVHAISRARFQLDITMSSLHSMVCHAKQVALALGSGVGPEVGPLEGAAVGPNKETSILDK
jgi:hypothetical protein